MADDVTTYIDGVQNVGSNVDIAVNSHRGMGPLVIEGEQVASTVREQGTHREVVEITDSMGDYLTWSVGDQSFYAGIGGDEGGSQAVDTVHEGDPPTGDTTAGSVNSAPHRGTPGGAENTMANEQELYETVPTNANGVPQGNPSPSAYRTVSESTLSQSQLAAAAVGIVLALVVGRRVV